MSLERPTFENPDSEMKKIKIQEVTPRDPEKWKKLVDEHSELSKKIKELKEEEFTLLGSPDRRLHPSSAKRSRMRSRNELENEKELDEIRNQIEPLNEKLETIKRVIYYEAGTDQIDFDEES